MSDEQLRKKALEAIEFDSLGSAENKTGKLYSEDQATGILGFAYFQKNRIRKRAILSELGDTHNDITWEQFLKLITDLGFEIIKNNKFLYWHTKEIVTHPSNLFAAHRTKKLLLHATSWVPLDEEEKISNGTIYGALDLNSIDHDNVWNALVGCSHSALHDDNILEFEYDIREGLVTHLQLIEQAAPFCSWPDPDRFLWLGNYVETKDWKDNSWRICRDEFILSAPVWVKEFMGLK